MATFLNAWAAALLILSVDDDTITPPVILLCGTNPKYEAKCLAEGNLDISVPTSDMICSIVFDCSPVIVVRSVPVIPTSFCCRFLIRKSFLLLDGFFFLTGAEHSKESDAVGAYIASACGKISRSCSILVSSSVI